MRDLAELRKRIFVNWIKLFSGSTAGAGLGLLATILMTRAIGVADVGIVAVVQTFWRMLEQFLSFQSYQVLIKHGADILHGQSRGSFSSLVKICMIADITMASAGACAGIVILTVFHKSMNIPDNILPVAALGVCTMFTMVTGAPMGILRLHDKLNAVALRDVAVSSLRIALNGAAFLLHGSVSVFICIWIATEACGNLLIFFHGLRELRKQGHTGVWRAKLLGDPALRARPILKALFAVNLGTMIRILSEEGDTLLVNAFTGTVAAGEYKIAKNFSSIVWKFAGPLAQSVYPEIAKAVSERNRVKYKSIMLHTSLQGGLLGIGALCGWLLLGHWLIRMTVGAAYDEAIGIILIITGGYAVGFLGVGLTPSLYAFNRLNQYLASAIVCTSAYFAIALPLLPVIGMYGSAWGQVACYVSGALLSAYIAYKSYRAYTWT